MINFLKFIEEDIDAKKTLLSTMPTRTKRDITKLNEKVSLIEDKYTEYKVAVKKYIDTKSRSFEIKETSKPLDKLIETVTELEHIRYVLNPCNTYFEKMGFDNSLYEISNYYNFNFASLNDVIGEFLNKFDQAGIRLSGSDFNYTCYVNEYMTAFLEVRYSGNSNFDKIADVFEKIYWLNPEIIQHIELNFRKLIRKNEKSFVNHIEKIQKKVMLENSITSYDDCCTKLKDAYTKLNEVNNEGITSIIKEAKAGEIDMNNYAEDSKFRVSAFSSMMIDETKITDQNYMKKFYESLEKLKLNVEEFKNYTKFLPIITDFKKEYEKQIPKETTGKEKVDISKPLKEILDKIVDKENKLDKLNSKVIGNEPKLFNFQNDNQTKQIKINTVKEAKELYTMYKEYDKEYFKEKVLKILSSTLSVSDLLHLYYSFDFYKKAAISKVFNTNIYAEIVKYSEEFDLFAMNPLNVITSGVMIFEQVNISKIIMNKYRLDNVNLSEENLNPDDLEPLLNKILFILRVNEINNSETNPNKIWFMAQVEKINNKEKKAK